MQHRPTLLTVIGLKISGPQSPDARSPWRLYYVRWRLIFVGPPIESASYHPYGAYNFETTLIFLVNMYTHAIDTDCTACITAYYLLATYWLPLRSP
jgi:hypothetical protein